MSWIDAELALIALGAMLSPTTLRSPCWRWCSVSARCAPAGGSTSAPSPQPSPWGSPAFVLGDTAASRDSSPKTWVAIFDVVAAALLLGTSRDQEPAARARQGRQHGDAHEQGRVLAGGRDRGGAGAVLANPGAFIPLALKSISETDPSAAGYRRMALLHGHRAAPALSRAPPAAGRARTGRAPPGTRSRLADRACPHGRERCRLHPRPRVVAERHRGTGVDAWRRRAER